MAREAKQEPNGKARETVNFQFFSFHFAFLSFIVIKGVTLSLSDSFSFP